MVGDEEYESRIARFDVASRATVRATAALPNVTWLDVRSEGEHAEAALPLPHVHCPVTMSSTERLEQEAAALLPKDRAAPILCFCGVGGRVMRAKQVLERLGYTAVFNAGGLRDLTHALGPLGAASPPPPPPSASPGAGARPPPAAIESTTTAAETVARGERDAAALGAVAEMSGHDGIVWHVAWRPDGRFLASCGADRCVRIWCAAESGKWVCSATLEQAHEVCDPV